MKRLFGTDGIRGLANHWPLTASFVVRLGQAMAQTLPAEGGFQGHNAARQEVVIGRDPRQSGSMLESALAAGLASQGVDAALVGVIPTPGVAFLTRNQERPLGIVISASHNPFNHNGIKLFGADGFKIPDEVEEAIERLALDGDEELAADDPDSVGRCRDASEWQQAYVDHLVAGWGEGRRLAGRRIVLDCANGATSEMAPMVFRRLGADVVLMNHEPDGANINVGYEYIEPRNLSRRVVQEQADVGVAFDGDGDRVILVDGQGQFLDGDDILALLARDLRAGGRLAADTIVATGMSNLGLHHSLADLGIRVEETPVGDRYVLQRMLDRGYVLGGEQSGHIIRLGSGQTTGDGIETALAVLRVLAEAGGPDLAELRAWIQRFPNVLVNRTVTGRPPLEGLGRIEEETARLRSAFGAGLEVNFRYSGTEDLLRLKLRSGEPGPSEEELYREAMASARAVADEIERIAAES